MEGQIAALLTIAFWLSPKTAQITLNTTLPTYNLAACGQRLAFQNIEGTYGHLFYQSTNGNTVRTCRFTLQVPFNKIVQININVCQSLSLRLTEVLNVTFKRLMACHNRTSLPQVHSLTDTVTLSFQFFENMKKTGRSSILSLYFSAVNESARPSLELIPLSPLSGYIQSPSWDGSTPYPPFMMSCVTLTPPDDHIIYFNFLAYEVSAKDKLISVPGNYGTLLKYFKIFHPVLKQMHVHRYASNLKLQAHLYPDDFFPQHAKPPLPLSFCFYANSMNLGCGFRLWYSFYSRSSKPERLSSGEVWNCSRSVWPDLSEHFPCDLISQCADSEDEIPCPYTTEKCGLDKIQAGQNCYIYQKAKSQTWFKSYEECRRLGGFLVSIETPQKWDDVSNLLRHSSDVFITIGLQSARLKKGSTFIDSMYKHTWQWISGSVAYYLRITNKLPGRHCGLLNLKLLRRSTSFKVNDFPCHMQRTTSFLCDLSSFSNPKQTSEVPTFSSQRSSAISRVSLAVCPLQHLVHDMLACDSQSLCEEVDVIGRYNAECTMIPKLLQPYFYCDVSGEYVPYSLVCDHRKDCRGGDDENFCVHPPCVGLVLNCGGGQCVNLIKRCDGFQDCIAKLDEIDCPKKTVFYSNTLKPPAVVNFNRKDLFFVIALPANTTQCPDTHFQCPDGGYCMPVYVRCNGINDCPNHEDEMMCGHFRCPGFYRCRGKERTICVHMTHICDGLPQCPQHDDELLCDLTCPEPCVCYGLAVICTHPFQVHAFPQLRYLEARGTHLLQADLLHNIMLIRLGVQACGWYNLTDFNLTNLYILDLSDNLLRHINFSNFIRLHQLREVNFAGNPIATRLSDVQSKYLLLSLKVANFSHITSDVLNLTVLSAALPELQVLDLTGSGIKSLTGRKMFPNLQVLDLRGVTVSHFTADFMKSMNSLERVSADSFKLCCATVLPDDFRGKCFAESDQISSCEDLLTSNIYRLFLTVLSLPAILGNFSCFVYRLWSSAGKIKTGFSLFVINLCLSDFLMGLYLAIIGLADRVYSGVYVWNDVAWKTSAACSVAGFLSLLSSEVSAFIICLITLDRFIVLRFPFSQVRFGSTSALLACATVWTVGLVMASVPLHPVLSHWRFYQQTSICIPLPITSVDFAGHYYSFSVMIICNLVLFLLIGVGQSLIYWSIRSNAMPKRSTKSSKNKDDQPSVTSKDTVIAIRLLTIAMSDFLCWFPIGLSGVMAALGVTISDKVNVVMAIVVLPLNSAINPFIYTLNVVMEKRQKAQEARLQKFLHAYLKKLKQ